MRPVTCEFCKHWLFDVSEDFRGKVEIICRRCKSKNLVRSWPGGYVGTVSLFRKRDLAPRVRLR